MNSIKDIICYMALLAMAGISTWTFWNILLYGEFIWYDPSKATVVGELIISISLMGLAIERFIRLLKN